MMERLGHGDEASVPLIWLLEVVNALLSAERHKHLRQAQSNGFLAQLASLPIHIDSLSKERAFGQVLAAARQYRLTSYDAAYLELAMREGLPLATIDTSLRSAARTAGVRLVPAGMES
jgi:predicted nucleic acid-binding protein